MAEPTINLDGAPLAPAQAQPQQAQIQDPGDTVTAQLKFFSPKNHVGKVAVGMEFEIREGKRTVATDRVTEILHLKENAAGKPRN